MWCYGRVSQTGDTCPSAKELLPHFFLVRKSDVPSAHLFCGSFSGISAASCFCLYWFCLDSELDPWFHAGSPCCVWKCYTVSMLTGSVTQRRSPASE